MPEPNADRQSEHEQLTEQLLGTGAFRDYGLNDLPRVAGLAWTLALWWPECGDDIMADLQVAIAAVIEREKQRIEAEAEARWRERGAD